MLAFAIAVVGHLAGLPPLPPPPRGIWACELAGAFAGTLVVEVRDDGVGGADQAKGTGLTGLADRLAVVGGRLSLSSPPGGPTLVRAEIPCVAEGP